MWRPFVLLFLALSLPSFGAEPPAEAKIEIWPRRIELDMPANAPQLLTRFEYRIVNRTRKPWRFSNLYDCWAPVLVSEAGVDIPLTGGGRDVTAQPRIEHFPFVKAGAALVGDERFYLTRTDGKLSIVFGDKTGGMSCYDVKPGKYRLRISYHPRWEVPLFQNARQLPGLNPTDVWIGAVMSNWIDLSISESGNAR